MKTLLDRFITPVIFDSTSEILIQVNFHDDPVKNFILSHDFDNLVPYILTIYFGPFLAYQNKVSIHKDLTWFNIDLQIKTEKLPKLSTSCVRHPKENIFVFSKTILYKNPNLIELIFDLEDNIYVNTNKSS